MRLRPITINALRAALAALWVAAPVAGQVAGPTGPQVTIRTIEPEPVRGRLMSLTLEGGAVVRTDPGEKRIPTSDLVRIILDTPAEPVPVAESSPVPREHSTVALSWGDVLSGKLGEPRDDSLVLTTTDLGEVVIPLDAVARVTSAEASTAAFRASVEWFFRSRSTDEDAVLLSNGDVIRGFIGRIDSQAVTIDGPAGAVSAPHRLVLAVQVAHPPPPPIGNPHAVVDLRQSGRVTVSAVSYDGAMMEVRPRAGGSARLAVDRVSAIDVAGGRWVWLTELRPLSYEQVPMLGRGWEFRIDRNVLDGPLNVGGERFERGLGVHSRSVLVYELDAAYREFVTSFGMDDDSGPLADVNVAILVDGQRRYEKPHVRRGTLVEPVRIDVARAGRIELVVDFGDNGDVQDRFNWIEPALVR